MKKYDAIIIGTGQAGPPLAGRLASEGYKTAIIERDKFGGTCVNTGCTPTKALVASARAAHLARKANEYGVNINSEISVDMKKVKARKDELVESSSSGVEKWLKGEDNITVYEGHTRFTGPKTIQIDDGETITAEKIFINVGGRARIPNGLEKVDYYTNSSIMDVDFIPEHLVIVGGGYVGLEFGQMYRRFGSEVTIVHMESHLVQHEDEDVSEAVQEILKEEEIQLRLNATCIGGRNEKGKVIVNVDCKDDDREVEGSHLLIAAGRIPNTDDLGLDKAGIETDEKGYIKVDDQLQTNVEGIWAMGDCNGQGAFTHTSYNDFEIVAANLFDNDPRKVTDRIPCYALYIDPALGRVGMTEKEVRASGKKALIATMEMSKVARAKEKGETKGFMKILVDEKTEKILGASILGIEGDEIIHSILDVMYAEKPYTLIQRAVHIHPTVSELIPTMLGKLEPLE